MLSCCFDIAANSLPGFVKEIGDVIKIDAARVRQCRPGCRQEERHRCGPDSKYRPYLTFHEDVIINEGIIDYSQSRNDGIKSTWRSTLEASPDHVKRPKRNPVLSWLGEVTEEVLDPYVFDPRCCGEAAAEALFSYRNEREPGFDPALMLNHEFPLTFLEHHGLVDRWGLKLSGQENTNDARTPRCKKIRQICDLHEMVSDSIFVLVDASFRDMNDYISDLGGPLPVPGFPLLPRCPTGFRTQPGFRQIPYEELKPRCAHGLIHPPRASYCRICFPGGYHVGCMECSRHHIQQLQRVAGAQKSLPNVAGISGQSNMDRTCRTSSKLHHPMPQRPCVDQ